MTSRLGFGWAVLCLALSQCPPALAQPLPPQLTAPVNDFAHVIDPSSAQEIDRRVRALEKATGDVVVVATVRTFQPYGDIKEYAVKMFENGGKGIGARGKDNGVLVVVAVEDRKVRNRGRLRPRGVHHRRLRGSDDPGSDPAGVPQRQLRPRTRRWHNTDHQPDRGCPRREPAGRSSRRAATAATIPHSDRDHHLHHCSSS